MGPRTGTIYALKKLAPYLQASEFTIYTDHKPLRSLFINENKNSKIQRWPIAVAEMGAKIKYREGANNVRADTLSRIVPESTPDDSPPSDTEPLNPEEEIMKTWLHISAMVEEDNAAVQLEELCKQEIVEIHVEGDPGIPWDFNELETREVIKEQQQMAEYEPGKKEEDDCLIMDELLYTIRPPAGKVPYPRLVLPPSTCFRVIRRAQPEVGDQGMRKMVDRLQECYTWPGLPKDVWNVLNNCNGFDCNVSTLYWRQSVHLDPYWPLFRLGGSQTHSQ